MNRVAINLHILSTLQPNERLGTEGSTTFDVYKPGLYNSLLRRLRGDTRALNLARLELCVHHAISHMCAMCHEMPRGSTALTLHRASGTHGDVHDVGVTTALLSAAANGLRNLALTYANDVATAAGIHALVELIGYHLQNMHQK
jgi:hypothetical protein